MRLDNIIKKFQSQNILLLQGPVGPFFYSLSKKLKEQDCKVYKINFNGGDFLFYPFNALTYRKSFEAFPEFLEKIIKKYAIECIILFNDCRPIHKISLDLAKILQIPCYVFEEGYIRPDFITFEKSGVNAYSKIPKSKNFYLQYSEQTTFPIKKVQHSFRNMAWFSFLYWFASFCFSWYFNNLLHHRSLSPKEMFPWFLSLFRKWLYIWSEKNDNKRILASKKKYFIAILQVHNDTQIKNHFTGRRIENFIKNTIKSFAKNSKPKHFLVIKHHPMDRGYRNYKNFIKRQTKKYNITHRVIYIHDSHLPTLLHNALGCIVINSTTGLSALLHNCPTKVCGNAFYDIDELTFQESLDKFWKATKKYKINLQLYKKFRSYLIDNTQINGSFYGKLSN
ncbi:capsular biosynthesis protein [Helicobacter apodemus]|uniref:Capsular biosynthesis protein n=1 Tax=Helicobacter apodemus TaxID=135569 RepID=A0A4U8UHI6_9HELI|nr:capsular biosynthesis protein [Helicobacter apodemus]TLE16079.1 capsular biosynthesis protein [Helicobacter apodemus]